VKARGVNVARPKGLINWMTRETKLGNPTLAPLYDQSGPPDTILIQLNT